MFKLKLEIFLKAISRKSDVRKAGLDKISQFLAQLNRTYSYSTVQGIGKFRADRLFSHQTFVKWPLDLREGYPDSQGLSMKIIN